MSHLSHCPTDTLKKWRLNPQISSKRAYHTYRDVILYILYAYFECFRVSRWDTWDTWDTMKATTKKNNLPAASLRPSDSKFVEMIETDSRYYLRFYVRPRFVVYAEYSWANDLMGFRVFYGEEKLKFSNYYSLIKWCDQHD